MSGGVKPLVSIGLPVYNAGHLIRTALDSLLAQTYPNIELIISDNASTDETREICREYAARDVRIRLYRNQQNIGAAANFMRVFELSTGKYFMWAAHDDSWDASFVAVSVEKLEGHPEAVLCYTDQHLVDVAANQESDTRYNLAVDDPVFSRRASTLLTARPTPYAIIYGLYVRERIAPALPFPQTAATDLFFLLKVAKYGTFVHIPQVLYSRKFQAKEFHARSKSVIPSYRRLPRSLVFGGLLLRMAAFGLKSGENLSGKLRIALAAARYTGVKMLVYTIPDGVRKGLRGLVGRKQTQGHETT
jgi:glycosyltransferase involved in cell wall biosynthesis